jgi:hypothetical protein
MRFQHDGAPPHYRREERKQLSNNYHGHSVGRGREAPVSWPARSPNLISLDFFVGGCLVTKICASRVESLVGGALGRSKIIASEIKNTAGIFECSRISFSRKEQLLFPEYGDYLG